MVFISIKKNLEWKWSQSVHINHPNMHLHTGNVCYIVVKTVHILIPQFNNWISINTTHSLKYISCLSVSHMFYSVRKKPIGRKENLLLVFACYPICSTWKNIHKISCYYRVVNLWLSHKFIHSRNTKISILPAIYTHSRDTLLWQHTSWRI